jgi:hypothetical protein
MQVKTKYLRLNRTVGLGDDIDGWQVCWLGGWDKCRVLFAVMVKRVTADMPGSQSGQGNVVGFPGCVAAVEMWLRRNAGRTR